MKPTAIFLLGHVSKQAKANGETITADDLATIEEIGDRAGVDVELLFACTAPATHGRKPLIGAIRAERERLLADIAASDAKFVVAFGPVAITALWNKAGVKLSELRLKTHTIADVALPVCATNSLEEMAFKPGLRKWAALDVLHALGGSTPSQFGEYHVQAEIRPELAEYLAAGGDEVSMDLETYPGLDPYHPAARIRMAVVSHRSGFAQVVQADPASSFPKWFVDLLADASVRKSGSHVRYDVRWLRRFGYEVNNFICTEHMEHLLDENAGIRDLKTLTLKYHPTLGDYSAGQRKLVQERDVYALVGKKRKLVESGWGHVRDDEMYDYAGGDGDAGITVFHAQLKRIKDEGLARPFAAMCEYYPAITQLELAGACVDMAENAALEERYISEISRLQSEIRGLLGSNINPRSPAQLVPALQALVPNINLKKFMFGKKDADENPYSTEAFVLKREAEKNPVIKTILEFRRRVALHNFVKGMRKHVVKVNGRDYVFSSIRGDITSTYRHSSSRPNLQNLPRSVDAETELGLNVKRQYISRFEGGSIMEFDESQLELREAGMIANDQALIAAFASGEDVHTTLAAMMRGVQPAQVTKQMRSDGKTTNFHVLYGGGAYGLSMRLGCEHYQAKMYVDQFYDTFTGFKSWEKARHQQAMTELMVESRFGFRRRFVRPADWASPLGRHIKRQAANAPIQGGASTLTNLGITRALRLMREAGLRSVPFLTVHDSLVVDVYPGEEAEVRRLVTEGMERPECEKYGVDLTIPLVVDCKGGPNWGSIVEVK